MDIYLIVTLIVLLVQVNCGPLDRDFEQILHPRSSIQIKEQLNRNSATSTAEKWITKAQNTLKMKTKTPILKACAKNIIFFLGDGMSIPTLMATRVYAGGEDVELSFEKFPFTGLSKTYCDDYQVADSACTATAYLCGIKANFATIGVNSNVKLGDCHSSIDPANHVHSIAKWAQDAGKATGLVTTTTVTHASPAGVYAHTADRFWESNENIKQKRCDDTLNSDIAKQLIRGQVGSKLDVIMGGGRRNFLPTNVQDNENKRGDRTDGINLINEWKAKNPTNAAYIVDKSGLQTITTNTNKVLGLFANGHMPFNVDMTPDRPKLHEMVKVAIDVLKKNRNGFFLFVEGGQIDLGHHLNLPHIAVDETYQLSLAVDVATSTTNERDTLIVLTSDHSHTMSISGYPVRGSNIFGPAFGGPFFNNFAKDNLPVATLNYANGQGYYTHTRSTGGRYDIRTMNNTNPYYLAPALAPLDMETHGGDDVAIFAKGPFAQLFSGVVEQHLIPHAMAYAACIGPGITYCNDP